MLSAVPFSADDVHSRYCAYLDPLLWHWPPAVVCNSMPDLGLYSAAVAVLLLYFPACSCPRHFLQAA
jgi:hypothetical protein